MKRSTIRWAGVAAVAALALTACSSGSDDPEPGGGEVDTSAVLNYTTTGGIVSFDPHKTRSSSDFILLNLIYDRLVHQDVDGDPVPGLAESWQFSDDMRTLTLTLREGLSFSDGQPFDAEAVKANLERAMEPDSITSPLLKAIDTVNVVDARTVELALNRPGAHLVLTLSDLPGMMVSPAAFANPDQLATQPVGIGRFELQRMDPGARYELVASDDYWDPEALKLAGFNIDVITDPETSLNAVRSGEYDCALVSPAMIAPAEQIPDATVKARTVLTQTVLYFNQTKGVLQDPAVRRAINLAVDREAVLQAAQEGQGEAARGLFPEDYFVPNEPVADLVAYDPDAARQLLADAGYTDGLEFTVLTLTIPQFRTTAEIIADQLAQIGITMHIQALPPQDMSVQFLQGEGDAVITGWVGRPDPAMLFSAYFEEDAPQNVSKVAPEGFDEALDAANAVEDRDARGEALADVARLVLEHGAVVPVTFNVVGAVCGDQVVGYEPSAVGASEFRGVAITR